MNQWVLEIDNECRKIQAHLAGYDDIAKFIILEKEIENFRRGVWLCGRKDLNEDRFVFYIKSLMWINADIKEIEQCFRCTFDDDNEIIAFFSSVVDIIANTLCPGCNDEGAVFDLIEEEVPDKDIEEFYREVTKDGLEAGI